MRQKSPLNFAALTVTLTLTVFLNHAPAQDRGIGVQVKVDDGRVIRLYDKSYALVIGVSDYTAGWPTLPGVKRDIEAVSRALERQGFQVTKVENPDSVQLEKSFKEFIDQYGRGVDSRLLFYFAGHGHTVKRSFGEEMGYIVPADAPSPARDAAGFMSKAMDMQQMETYARRIEAKHALFLFDSCFSGSIFALSRAIPASISYKTTRPVRQFITSGSAEEEVPDKSVFREQFVEAIEGEADTNHDGYVTGTELGEFLQDKVVNYSKNSQHPQYGKIRNPNLDKGDFVFVLPKAAELSAATASGTPGSAQPASPAPVDPAQQELAFWNSIQKSTDPEDFKDYLSRYPHGLYAGIARRRVTTLGNETKPGNLGGRPETDSPSTSAPNSTEVFPVLIRVRADNSANGRTDSFLMVRKGQRLRITATGRVSLGQGRFSTPSGLPRVFDAEKLMRDQPTGALIAVIGDDNDEFIFIGSARDFYAPRDGRLFLGVNEGNLADNTGAYDALIEVEPVTSRDR